MRPAIIPPKGFEPIRRERSVASLEPQRFCLHFGKSGVSVLLQGQLDAFHEQIVDFASLVEGDLPQRLISGLWQIDARMLKLGILVSIGRMVMSCISVPDDSTARC